MEELNKIIDCPMIPPWLVLKTTIIAPEGIKLNGFDGTTFLKKDELPYIDYSKLITPRSSKIMECPCCHKTINKNSFNRRHTGSKNCREYFDLKVIKLITSGDLIDTTVNFNKAAYFFHVNEYNIKDTISIINKEYPYDGACKNNNYI